ncbi:MAG TPA: KH domain-containing protein, partial [Candidatus Saccharimonadales bacterium]
MSNIDEQFVEFVVKSLVNKPDAVKVERRIDEKGVLLELTVDPEDLGRVIGKRGATAQSIRTLLRALGTKNDARYNLKIVDNGVFDRSSRPAPSTSTNDDVQQPAASDSSDDSDNHDEDQEQESQEEKQEEPVISESQEEEPIKQDEDGTSD